MGTEENILFRKILLILLACSIAVLPILAWASPDQQERSQRCQLEAVITQQGFAARVQLDKEEFEAKLKELVENAAKDPEITKEQIETAVKALRQGYAGVSPQKAYNSCMTSKQV